MERYEKLKEEYKQAMERWNAPVEETTQQEEGGGVASNQVGVAQTGKGVAMDTASISSPTSSKQTAEPVIAEEEQSVEEESAAGNKRARAEAADEKEATPTKRAKRETEKVVVAEAGSVGESRTPAMAQQKVAKPTVEHIPYNATRGLKDSKYCANDGCSQLAVFAEGRGSGYCSNECVVGHCR